MNFSKLHIFRYSKREGTAAARMKGQLPPSAMQDRSQRMHILNARLEETFRRKFVGRTLPVLWESSEPYGYGLQWSGLTGNYLRVVTQTGIKVNLQNQVIETELVDTGPAALVGRLPSAERAHPGHSLIIPSGVVMQSKQAPAKGG
jgi:threonylcarbamoyladenosine tRNA methylthiotransferase MtaB